MGNEFHGANLYIEVEHAFGNTDEYRITLSDAEKEEIMERLIWDSVDNYSDARISNINTDEYYIRDVMLDILEDNEQYEIVQDALSLSASDKLILLQLEVFSE